MKLSDRFISASDVMCDFGRHVPAPYIRKTFFTGSLSCARISVCGLGFYRFFVDGRELTKGFLSPYISNPDDILEYDVYDLTGMLGSGKHVLGFMLGNGMQNSFSGYIWDFDKAAFRSPPKLAVCLELTGTDGRTLEIEADETFLCAGSPILCDDLRLGEIYDASRETEGWNTPQFDDRGWTKAVPAEKPRGKKRVCACPPIVKRGEISHPAVLGKRFAVSRFSDRPFEGILFDFGVNDAGICKLKISGRRGQKLEMFFAEYLDSDGNLALSPISFHNKGTNLYIQKDVYYCRGEGVETWKPSFTYHGFRYVLVSGLDDDQISGDLLTFELMSTEMEERGGFSCSDRTLNTLQEMTRRSTLGNFYHFPTDCPHREKNGWTADAALSSEHTLLNLSPEANYVEWHKHICASMDSRGAIPGIIPTGGWGFEWGNGPAWDQVLVELPFLVYRYRGNREIVDESLPYLIRYVNYLTSRTDNRGLIEIGLGDWVAPYGVRSPLVFTDSVISMDICEKAAFLFETAGQERQAQFCRGVAEDFRNAVRKHLVDHATATAICSDEKNPFRGSQTSQAMGLYYGIFTESEKPAAFEKLLELLREENDHLDTGVLGARVIFRVLSDFGKTDYALRIMTDPTPPSYGDWIARGYTALAENFNLPGDNGSHVCSLNHHFLGDISAWFISYICGIRYNPDGRHHDRLVIAPRFAESLDYAEAFHICPYGKISVRWERKGESVILDLEIPDGVSGDMLPESGYHVSDTRLKTGRFIFTQNRKTV